MNGSGDLRDTTIIMFSMSRWDGVSSASLSLAKEFARDNRVFYIDHPYTLKDLLSFRKREDIDVRREALVKRKNIYRQIKGYPDNLTFVVGGLTFPINWMNKGLLYNLLNRINNGIVNQTLYKILQDYNITNYILFNSFNPFYGKHLSKGKNPLIRVYQSRDNIAAAPYIKKHGVYQEIKQVQNADFAFATSKKLVKNLSSLSNRKVHYLPNAADTSLFNKVANQHFDRPVELKNVKTKIIGYIGNIGVRIDYKLIKRISEEHADKSILFVGPDESSKYSPYALKTLPNLIRVGKRRLEELPQYLKHMDCAIIPFKIDELTKSIYPLKINEYLAAGKPVVSTNFSEDVAEFKNHIHIAKTQDDFINLIESALANDSAASRNSRIDFAKQNDWSKRVEQFWTVIENKKI